MRVLICGDRHWTDRELIRDAIYSIDGIGSIIEGEARGADRIAREIANEEGIPVFPFPADWTRWGRAAGPIRNQQMLVDGKPDLVLAFHDDLEHSKGTKDMVTRALKAGLPVWHWSSTGVKKLGAGSQAKDAALFP
jgi:hypothetical protein